ncbi:Helitron helicase-like domain-containing protein [Pleurotus pulmonarius]
MANAHSLRRDNGAQRPTTPTRHQQQVRQHTRAEAEQDILQQSPRRRRRHDENAPPLNSASETCNAQSDANAFLPASMRFGSPLLPSLGCLTPSQRANILQPHTPALSAVHTYNALPTLPLTGVRLLSGSVPRVTESAPAQRVFTTPLQPEDTHTQQTPTPQPRNLSQSDPVPNRRSLAQQARRARERAAKDLHVCTARPQQPTPPPTQQCQLNAPASQPPPNRRSLAQQARRARERASRDTNHLPQEVQQVPAMEPPSALPTPPQTQVLQLRPDSLVSMPPPNRRSLAQQARRARERASREANHGLQAVQPSPPAPPSPTLQATLRSRDRPRVTRAQQPTPPITQHGNPPSVPGQSSGDHESAARASRPRITLQPAPGRAPSYAQLYLYDPQSALQQRMYRNNELRADTMGSLQSMLTMHNPYAAMFKHAFEVLREHGNVPDFEVRFRVDKASRGIHPRRINAPTADEVAMVLPGDGTTTDYRDIILRRRAVNGPCLYRIHEGHPAYSPLHYVLLFPFGEPGWQEELRMVDRATGSPWTIFNASARRTSIPAMVGRHVGKR